jgi:hypothetical protein
MRKSLLLLAFFSFGLFFAGTTPAQTVQIFGGYSYLRPSVTLQSDAVCPLGIVPPCPGTPGKLDVHPNLNGWELSGTWNMYKWLGATADFSGHYGSDHGASIHYQTYLFGPQVHLPGPVSPFAHVLIGAAHQGIGTGINGIIAESGTAFAVAAGAGIDIHLAPFIAFRAIQLDYLVTRFNSSTQSQPRVSAGLVLHF